MMSTAGGNLKSDKVMKVFSTSKEAATPNVLDSMVKRNQKFTTPLDSDLSSRTSSSMTIFTEKLTTMTPQLLRTPDALTHLSSFLTLRSLQSEVIQRTSSS